MSQSFLLTAGSLLVFVLTGCATAQPTNTVNNVTTATVIELTSFQLIDGASEEQFLQAAAAMQHAFLEKQDGYLRRALVKGETGWTDIVYWQDAAAMEAALQRAESAPEVGPFMQLIDFSSVQMNQTEVRLAAN